MEKRDEYGRRIFTASEPPKGGDQSEKSKFKKLRKGEKRALLSAEDGRDKLIAKVKEQQTTDQG